MLTMVLWGAATDGCVGQERKAVSDPQIQQEHQSDSSKRAVSYRVVSGGWKMWQHDHFQVCAGSCTQAGHLTAVHSGGSPDS